MHCMLLFFFFYFVSQFCRSLSQPFPPDRYLFSEMYILLVLTFCGHTGEELEIRRRSNETGLPLCSR